ncbi:MAG: hypothetical protein GY875_25100 [Gammaproteobacteria bacterium]|nr:hypothetical protein [Gammaproteobacteria bacterium]
MNGGITAKGGAGNLNIDGTSIVSGTCDPNHPQCNGGPGGGGPGASCSTVQIAANGEEFRGISGSNDSNIIAAGKNGSLYHYDGSNWTKNAFTSNRQLRDVEVVAPNLAYAVGKKGLVADTDIAEVLIGITTAAELFESGRASIEGNQKLLQDILPTLDDFDPTFEILPLLKK